MTLIYDPKHGNRFKVKSSKRRILPMTSSRKDPRLSNLVSTTWRTSANEPFATRSVIFRWPSCKQRCPSYWPSSPAWSISISIEACAQASRIETERFSSSWPIRCSTVCRRSICSSRSEFYSFTRMSAATITSPLISSRRFCATFYPWGPFQRSDSLSSSTFSSRSNERQRSSSSFSSASGWRLSACRHSASLFLPRWRTSVRLSFDRLRLALQRIVSGVANLCAALFAVLTLVFGGLLVETSSVVRVL